MAGFVHGAGGREVATQQQIQADVDAAIAQVCEGATQLSLDTFLIPEGDPLRMMEAWMPEALAKSRDVTSAARRRQVPKWPSQHEDAWRG